MVVPETISIKAAFGIFGEIASKSWQRLWDNELSGRYTRNKK